MKSLDTVNLSYTPRQIFNFATRSVFTAYITELSKHYKQENIKRELTKNQILESEFLSENTKDQMLNEIREFEESIGIRD